MAPEILRYEKYDAKADLWSVGAVLYEMSVGRPPFRAQNHIELLKRIEHARSTVKFPDEDPSHSVKEPDSKPVAVDIKALIRSLLKRHPVERASYDEFFKSEALEKSKFKRPDKKERPIKASQSRSLGGVTEAGSIQLPSNDQGSGTGPAGKEPWVVDPTPTRVIPENHKVIPAEVLDPKANIPPSKFKFRRTSPGARVRAASEIGPSRPSFSSSPPMRAIGLDGEEVGLLRSPITTLDETEEDNAMQREYVLVD